MRYLIINLLAIIVLTIACEEKEVNPIMIKKEKDTMTGMSIEYQLDTIVKQKNGYYKMFYPNGKLAQEQQYKNDTLVGTERFYYEEGPLKSENNYLKGEFDGSTKEYYSNGKLKSEGTYVNNSLEGPFTNYYENGNVKNRATMKDSEENGPFEEYYENGNMKARGSYLNGASETCLLELWEDAESKELTKKMICRKHQCCTIWTAEKGAVAPVNSLCEEIIAEMTETCKLNIEELQQ